MAKKKKKNIDKEERRRLVLEQIRLMDEIRDKANINIVNCGDCGTILLHERDGGDALIKCFGCMEEQAQSDCPDYWFQGYEDNSEFNDD